MSRLAVRFWLLNKRLFKKFSFIIILCLVPALTAGIRLASHGESGMASVAIYRENPQDELTAKILERLTEEKTFLRYVFCETEKEAGDMVAGGRADAAWIFPQDLQTAMEQSAKSGSVEPVVTMLVRENNVMLVLIREVLTSLLYPHYSYEVYRDYVRETCGLEDVSDEELLEYYNESRMEGSLFQISFLNGDRWEDKGYLLTPIRGILALWLVLCSFAAALYFMQDERSGTFDGTPLWRRLWMSFGMQAVLLCDCMLVFLAAMRLSGLFLSWPAEILRAVLFSCCIAAMANLLRLLCRTPERFGCSIPILLLIMLALCPVFVNVTGWKAVKLLLPPYYYLCSLHNDRYLYGMVLYTVIAAGLCVLADEWRRRKYVLCAMWKRNKR